MSGYLQFLIFLFVLHRVSLVNADPCISHTGVEVLSCHGEGGGRGTGGGAQAAAMTEYVLNPCEVFPYTGPGPARFVPNTQSSYGIAVVSSNVGANEKAIISSFTCSVGGDPEVCYKYSVKNAASTEGSFILPAGSASDFIVRGNGDLNFMIVDGTNCPTYSVLDIPAGSSTCPAGWCLDGYRSCGTGCTCSGWVCV